MKSILITDSLFIFPKHKQQLKHAGYEVVRLDKPEASEQELCEAIKGKVGYILGGIEKVTDKVIDAADQLEAIIFTGIGFKSMIPGWQHAFDKGIAIGNVPEGPTQAVAERSIGAALAMNSGFFELARTGNTQFMTTPGLEGQTIGIIGLGHIGSRIAEILQLFQPKEILYFSTHHHEDKEQALGLAYSEMDDVLQKSDVVFLCVPDGVDKPFFAGSQFERMKRGALLVSFMHGGIIDPDVLYKALKSGKVRAISDYPMDERFNGFPLSTWYSFNGSNAFNTPGMLELASDEAVRCLLSLLATGEDKDKVN